MPTSDPQGAGRGPCQISSLAEKPVGLHGRFDRAPSDGLIRHDHVVKRQLALTQPGPRIADASRPPARRNATAQRQAGCQTAGTSACAGCQPNQPEQGAFLAAKLSRHPLTLRFALGSVRNRNPIGSHDGCGEPLAILKMTEKHPPEMTSNVSRNEGKRL